MCKKKDYSDININNSGNYLLPLRQEKRKGKLCYPVPTSTMLLRLLELADCMWGLRKGRILAHPTKRIEVLFTEICNVREI